MNMPILNNLIPSVAQKIGPMIQEIVHEHANNLHSISIVGSAVMPDYNEKLSDINSLIILQNMDLKFISFLAPLGKKYAKKRIAAPLVMTPEYVKKSTDAFPVEFLDFKLIHATVYGENILADIIIDRAALRFQCQRDIKIKLMGLRQGYISTLGKEAHLASGLIRSITGSMALFRAIIFLLGKEPPIPRTKVISALGDATGVPTDIFNRLLTLKAGTIKMPKSDFPLLFEKYYVSLEALEKITDNLND